MTAAATDRRVAARAGGTHPHCCQARGEDVVAPTGARLPVRSLLGEDGQKLAFGCIFDDAGFTARAVH